MYPKKSITICLNFSSALSANTVKNGNIFIYLADFNIFSSIEHHTERRTVY